MWHKPDNGRFWADGQRLPQPNQISSGPLLPVAHFALVLAMPVPATPSNDPRCCVAFLRRDQSVRSGTCRSHYSGRAGCG